MDLDAYFQEELEDHARVLSDTRAQLQEPFLKMLDAWETCIRKGGKLLFFGNGGSASDAQHLSAELVVRFVSDRAPIASIALNTDTSAITAGGNDLGYDQIFARQIEALGKPGDVAVAFPHRAPAPMLSLP